MYRIFLFDLQSYTRGVRNKFIWVLLLLGGVFCGNKFNLSIGEGVFLNGTYTIGYMVGFLSLSIIFIASIIGSRLLFKEWDSRFHWMIFSTPVTPQQFLLGRVFAFITLTFGFFCLVIAGFTIGQCLRSETDLNGKFNISYYLYPLLVLGCINTLLVCGVLFPVAILSRKKILLVIAGLLLYVLYMVMLIYSGSPLMANALPQSLTAQWIAAVTDPFGLSSYFYESKDLTVFERNSVLVPLAGTFLINRLAVIMIALAGVFLSIKFFSFQIPEKKHKRRFDKDTTALKKITTVQYEKVYPVFHWKAAVKSLQSYLKLDFVYLFKSVSFFAATLLVLFFVGMEMYAEIEKGIRIPQKYAGSGLMATAIIENFYLIGALLSVYFVNDVYWRSHSSGFSLIENTTPFSIMKPLGHWISICLLIFIFAVMLVAESVLFQLMYGYPVFLFEAYWGVMIFNVFPLCLLAALLILINTLFKNRFIALAISLLFTLMFSTPVVKKIISFPLLRFLTGFSGEYSDFNGYGKYLHSFSDRLIFGWSVVGFLWIVYFVVLRKHIFRSSILFFIICLLLAGYSAPRFVKGYLPVNENEELAWSANYEKTYKHYQHSPQPVVTDVHTRVDLYPTQNAYRIEGTYILENLTIEPILKVLVNFAPSLKTDSAVFIYKNRSYSLKEQTTEVFLSDTLYPGSKATLVFKLSYEWFPVNGHQSFNAIIENGSFMRISRYYPVIGYQEENELMHLFQRKQSGLGEPEGIKRVDAPKENKQDFIRLNMTVSTEAGQTPIGTGELIREWTDKDRSYSEYKTGEPVPFRFAVASAKYKSMMDEHRGIAIRVLYHPAHFENVEHLIEQTRQSLDYCIDNFGKYPYSSITYAEISSFTKGFNATAYPGVIFMTENVTFHANLRADKQQDVINELAGHELSHLWWGNNRIAPDDREGATMLTETLAMYTEMMIYKKVYGTEKMKKRLAVHRQIYESEKGFSVSEPLYKVTGRHTHISYSKGALVMVELSELIGEEKLNETLRHFLKKYSYPERPASTDFIQELYLHTDQKYHDKIKQLFTE
jgi:ABC-2 type transport system permease protein